MKLLNWLCLLCVISLSLQAQEVVTSSGGYGTTTGAKLTWTIGEPVTETIGTNTILTQGFNQGDILITLIKKPLSPGLIFKVYPNPTYDYLKIYAGDTSLENLNYILVDMGGKVVKEDILNGTETEIPVGNLTPSTYLLRVFQKKTEIAIFKIIKK